jgi:hypothetical protein
MQPSLGKMSVYKMFDWKDRATSSVEQTVAAFLEIGQAVATPLDRDGQRCPAPRDGVGQRRIGSDLRLR